MSLDDRTFEMMMRYLDGLLSEEEAAEFQELLESSEEVREEFRKYRELEDALGEVRKVAGNIDEVQFLAALHEKMDASHGAKLVSSSDSWLSGLQRWWGIAAGFAAGAVASWLFVLFYPGLSSNHAPTRHDTRVAVRTIDGGQVNPGIPNVGGVPDTPRIVPSVTNSAGSPVNKETTESASDVRLVTAGEDLKAYDVEYVSSEYELMEYSVTDDDGYRILVMFVSYDSDPAQAI